MYGPFPVTVCWDTLGGESLSITVIQPLNPVNDPILITRVWFVPVSVVLSSVRKVLIGIVPEITVGGKVSTFIELTV
jgi:hypothetical protein